MLSTRGSEQLNDWAKTLRNRARLESNGNLLFWYRELYRDQFKDMPHPEALSILEIGSGTSPLKRFHSNVVTSDVLELDYLDLVFDCHEIDKLVRIEDNSLDVITLTNVLHHLKSPIDFLNAAAAKLKPGGKGGEYHLVNLGLEPLPPEAIVDGAIMDSGAVIDAIQRLFSANKIKTAEVATSVSGNSMSSPST